MKKIFDFIIIGGGSAGSVLGNRLSKDPSNEVLVLEAGPSDHKWDFRLHMPAALTYPLTSKTYNWWYESDPEPHMKSRRIYHPRGKVLGGSSSINGMIWIRGNPLDYQKWADNEGLENWDYDHCLPYFKKQERRLIGGDNYHGDDGPLYLTTPECENPLFDAFFKSVQEAGYPFTSDVNGYQQEGFGKFDQTIYRARRYNAAQAYIHPVKHRNNLTVKTRSLVTKIIIEGKKAIGVEIKKGASIERIYANEIISCGGAINSPQLLQISGIGNADHLSNLGIDASYNLPGVGQNLQDHLEVYVQWACKKPVSLYPSLSPWRAPKIGFDWL
ncbi:MAG: GMC family oxidoreductase N-terminal domain-containing protein, partial [Candidatus Marinimicrobia bacterium]|nr:GMC family oxidoreductase N-terminal domain-containing protein [Candidatus Neomarinimicrobiota bacterium]